MAYRVRKEGGVGASIAGMFLGMLLIVFGAPIAAWQAESQDRETEFTSATVVESDSEVEGYIVVEDQAVLQDDLLCPYPGLNGYLEGEDEESDAGVDTEEEVAESVQASEDDSTEGCLYVNTIQEQYEREEKEYCGRLNDNQTVLRNLDDMCDEDGENCQSCYLVEEYDWAVSDDGTTEELGVFTLGDYEVDADERANFIGLEELVEYEFPESKTEPVEGDMRWTYEFFPADQKVLVAGSAEDNQIRGAYDGKPFVISDLSYQGTVEALQRQDATAMWGLRLLSLTFMVVGMVLITGPLTLFTNVFRLIPLVGKHMDKGLDGVVGFIAAVIGFFLWVLLYGIVLVLKNIVLVIIVLALIGAGVFSLVKKGKRRAITEV